MRRRWRSDGTPDDSSNTTPAVLDLDSSPDGSATDARDGTPISWRCRSVVSVSTESATPPVCARSAVRYRYGPAADVIVSGRSSLVIGEHALETLEKRAADR